MTLVIIHPDGLFQLAGDGGDTRWLPAASSHNPDEVRVFTRELPEEQRQAFGEAADTALGLLSGLLRLRTVAPELSDVWLRHLQESLDEFEEKYDQALRAADDSHRSGC